VRRIGPGCCDFGKRRRGHSGPGLRIHLRQYDALADAIAEIDQQVDATIAKMDVEVAAGQASFRTLISLLCTIPGASDLAAKTVLAEIGTDVCRFSTAGHLLVWAGTCPAQNESAGKRKSSRLRKGSPWLKTGRPLARRTATIRRISTAYVGGMARTKRSAPWPLRCSRQSITC
jgi:transposase